MCSTHAQVRVAPTGPRGLREGAVVEVLERANQTLVGRYLEKRGIGVVVPEERRISQDLLVPTGARRGAKPGQVVVAEIVEQPTRHAQPIDTSTGRVGFPWIVTAVLVLAVPLLVAGFTWLASATAQRLRPVTLSHRD